jgi:tetratricopeptide (TPR) repeat protein
VRRFSRSVLFELDEAIRNLPGATSARNLLLARATEFLDNLAGDPSSDAALKIEVAEGYRRLGHVQGSSFSDNLGRRDAAIQSFRKAVRLGEEALASAPHYAHAGVVLMGAYDDLTSVFANQNDFVQAQPWYEKHRQLLAELDRRYPGDRQVRSSVASSYSARFLPDAAQRRRRRQAGLPQGAGYVRRAGCRRLRFQGSPRPVRFRPEAYGRHSDHGKLARRG